MRLEGERVRAGEGSIGLWPLQGGCGRVKDFEQFLLPGSHHLKNRFRD